LALKPYNLLETRHEIDFFGNTLTLIRDDGFSSESKSYEKVPGSEAEVLAKAAEAEAFLSRTNWQVGVWEIRDGVNLVDLTLRPDGYYLATNATEILRGVVRGRYSLEPGRMRLFPFVGQGLYSRDNGDFGKVERMRELDFYDGELQWIDPEAISQRISLARKRPGSEAEVTEKARQARAERARDGWHIGVWEVWDPMGWMEFTFRPDHRYIAKSGTDGVPGEVERGRYLVTSNKVTLAPYSGQGAARGFELDLFDGDFCLAGDLARLVVGRKVPGSETVVVEKTINPVAAKGERGSILGLWTANIPGRSAELVFRPDGQFRLRRCQSNTTTYDYGLFDADMSSRALVSDSRFFPVQNQELDFYGETLTIYGGSLGPPSTYVVNLGLVDAAIQASLAADAEEAVIDSQWMARIPVGPRDPNAVQIPTGDIPADPFPGRIFESPAVFTQYQLYRRLIPGFVYFHVQGSIRSVPVVHTREWHFFPTGRVLARFKNYRAGVVYPVTVADVTSSWGAYRVEPKPTQQDILHLFADNGVFIETDLGERIEMTLEDGRRHLFWEKDYLIQSEWAAEQKPIPCQLPGVDNPGLMNTGLSLATNIDPDPTGERRPLLVSLARGPDGSFALSGTADVAERLVLERAASLADPIQWQPVQTNNVPAGAFQFAIPPDTNTAAFYRLRGE
jgi:hypothetical protein